MIKYEDKFKMEIVVEEYDDALEKMPKMLRKFLKTNEQNYTVELDNGRTFMIEGNHMRMHGSYKRISPNNIYSTDLQGILKFIIQKVAIKRR